MKLPRSHALRLPAVQPLRLLLLVLGFAYLMGSDVMAQTAVSTSGFKIARLKYPGGGDWYNDPSAEPNLLNFLRKNTNIQVDPQYQWVDIGSDDIFNYPFLFLTGHGNVDLSSADAARLRSYLESGGFLYIDDDYGLDKSIRREMKKVFPDEDFQELPFNHPIYHEVFDFPNGLPKIHEHDGKPPQGFGLFYQRRLVVYYTYETNPSDGWADPEVHDDPPEKRLAALKMGANIVAYALAH